MIRKRVLYAEDEFINRKLIEIRLRKEGIVCDLAENGRQALDLFRSRRYDLVILDNYMPELNGADVARSIRSENTAIPIIAITSDDEEIPTLKKAGCNEIFIKPLYGPAYMQRILKHLQD
ncbi:response regulator [Sediminispirochaeta smaragdinae]|jgi:CheY-like chemotaxis protein|uniref:response regulator n=1 Tax=Sediminispirochaeta smaragdinae TaxID=55206 RepID=UPI0002DC9593|nr:response regulator [Sediminispirochaeta smaragdinae]